MRTMNGFPGEQSMSGSLPNCRQQPQIALAPRIVANQEQPTNNPVCCKSKGYPHRMFREPFIPIRANARCQVLSGNCRLLGGQILRDRDPDLRQHRSPDRQSAKISGDDLTLRLVQLFVEGQQFHDISADVQTDFTPPIVPKE